MSATIPTDDFVFRIEPDGSLRRSGLRLHHWIAPVAFALILVAMMIMMGGTLDLSAGLLVIPGLFLTLTIIRIALLTGAPRVRIDRSAQRVVLDTRGVVTEIPFREVDRVEYRFQPDQKRTGYGHYFFVLLLTGDRVIPLASLSGQKERIASLRDQLNEAFAAALGKPPREIP